VAWTRLETVYQFFSPPPTNNQNSPLGGADPSISSATEYSFLCPDGSTLPLNTDAPCTWAGRPWKGFLVTNRLSTTATISDIQQQISLYRNVGATISSQQPAAVFSWLLDTLEFGPQEVEFHVPATVAATVTPLVYLDRGNYTLTIEKPSCPTRRTIRICVRNDLEKLKCMALRMASIGRRIIPHMECILGEDREDCMRKVSSGQADVTTVDAREAFVGARYTFTQLSITSYYFDVSRNL